MGQQRRGPAPLEPVVAEDGRSHATELAFELGNEAARSAMHGGGDPDDEPGAKRAALVHARLALQLHPAPPIDLARWLGILRDSALPAERRELLLARLNHAQVRALEVADAVADLAGHDGADVRAALSDQLGAAICRRDEGAGDASEPLAALCEALARIRFDDGDEEALLADQVAEEQA